MLKHFKDMKMAQDVVNSTDIHILVLKMVQSLMMMMVKVQKMEQEPLVDILKMQLENKCLERK